MPAAVRRRKPSEKHVHEQPLITALLTKKESEYVMATLKLKRMLGPNKITNKVLLQHVPPIMHELRQRGSRSGKHRDPPEYTATYRTQKKASREKI